MSFYSPVHFCFGFLFLPDEEPVYTVITLSNGLTYNT
jgi:hypothetical protein